MKKNNVINWAFWIGIILSTLLLCLPSWVRIFNLRCLYLSASTRSLAVTAVNDLRLERGYAATDLNLVKIDHNVNGTGFNFVYRYHHPAVVSHPVKLMVEYNSATTTPKIYEK